MSVPPYTSTVFLSTPSARRATTIETTTETPKEISIHALCEEGDQGSPVHGGLRGPISIHALCEEGDTAFGTISARPTNFYPRPLRGGRRPLGPLWWPVRAISIHALCEEGDPHTKARRRPSCRFLSTPSARRAT